MVKNRTEVCSPPILRFDPCSSCIAWLCEASRCLRGGWRCWQRMSSAAGLRQQHQRNQRLGLARRRLGFASPDEELHKKRETFLGKDVRSYHRICRLKQLTVHFSYIDLQYVNDIPMASLHDVMICGLRSTCGTEFVGGLDKIAAIEQHGQKAVTDDFGEEDKVYDVEDVTTFSFTQALRVVGCLCLRMCLVFRFACFLCICFRYVMHQLWL